MTYVCSKCGIEKPNSEFHKASVEARGLRYDCKSCCNAATRAYARANPKKVNAQHRKWCRANPLATKRWALKKNFGITLEHYNEMFATQNGVCAICQEKCKSGMALAVDHIHGSEPTVIRGLLCMNCNNAIGRLQDSPQNCLVAAEYLQRSGSIKLPLADVDKYASPC